MEFILPSGLYKEKDSLIKVALLPCSTQLMLGKPRFQILLTAIEEGSIGRISADVLESIRD